MAWPLLGARACSRITTTTMQVAVAPGRSPAGLREGHRVPPCPHLLFRPSLWQQHPSRRLPGISKTVIGQARKNDSSQNEPVLDPRFFGSAYDEPQSFASLVTLRKLQGIVRAATEVTIRHAIGRPKAATWSYPFEMAVEITRVVISDVVTQADVVTLQSGSPREARQVRNKIAMVQRLLKTGGVPAVFGSTVEPLLVGGMPAEWIRPSSASLASWIVGGNNNAAENGAGSRSRGAILYLHGGAYLTCGIATHRRLMSKLAVSAGLPVLGVDYRLMPQASFSDILQDALTSFDYLMERGFRPEDIVLAGDSAGGHLCLCLSMLLHERGRGQKPGALVAFSPWVDPIQAGAATMESWTEFKEVDYIGRIHSAIGVPQMGFQDHPMSSLLRPDAVGTLLEALPPTLIQAGSRECLAAEISAFVNLLRSAKAPGLDLTSKFFEDQVHVFQMFAEVSGPAEVALDEAGDFIRQKLSQRPVPAPYNSSATPSASSSTISE